MIFVQHFTPFDQHFVRIFLYFYIGDFNVNYFCKHLFLYQHLQSSLSSLSLTQNVKEATHTSPDGI